MNVAGAYETPVDPVVGRIAASAISALITGETGVGKEVLAERLHRMSPRAAQPFLRLHCAALSEALFESELFGHERGAFTGADKAKPGLLETANRGTVFLDEIGELSPTMQVKLLRVIETRKVLPVGGLVARPIDVRFIAATHRDLEAESANGRFRQDLYFRLNGVTLSIPPLRRRVAEIAGLARTFLAQAVRSGEPAPALSAEALAILEAYAWPGNIRELRNLIERAAVLSPGATIGASELPELLRAPAAAAPPALVGLALPIDERREILHALARTGGNQTEAAKLVGVSRRTLINRMIAYDLPRPRKRLAAAQRAGNG
jgi:two-component system response regulator AtoC